MTTAGAHAAEGIVVDVVYRPTRHRPLPLSGLTAEEKAAQLQEIQVQRAKLAAREAEPVLAFAAERPDDDDPAPGTPGARSRDWRQSDLEFPGVSESFPHELAMVLNVAPRHRGAQDAP